MYFFSEQLLIFIPLIIIPIIILFINLEKKRELKFYLNFLIPLKRKNVRVVFYFKDLLRLLIKLILLFTIVLFFLDISRNYVEKFKIINKEVSVFFIDDSVSSLKNKNFNNYFKEIETNFNELKTDNNFFIILSNPNNIIKIKNFEEIKDLINKNINNKEDFNENDNLIKAFDYLIFLKKSKKIYLGQEFKAIIVSDFQRNKYRVETFNLIQDKIGIKSQLILKQFENIKKKINASIKNVTVEKLMFDELKFTIKVTLDSNYKINFLDTKVGVKQKDNIQYLFCQDNECVINEIKLDINENLEIFLFHPFDQNNQNNDEIFEDNFFFVSKNEFKSNKIGILSYQGSDNYFESYEYYLYKVLSVIAKNSQIDVFYETSKISSKIQYDLFFI